MFGFFKQKRPEPVSMEDAFNELREKHAVHIKRPGWNFTVAFQRFGDHEALFESKGLSDEYRSVYSLARMVGLQLGNDDERTTLAAETRRGDLAEACGRLAALARQKGFDGYSLVMPLLEEMTNAMEAR